MKTEDKLTEFAPTGMEVMHYILIFCYNWTQDDFKIAFKDSRLGWDYHWNVLQGKCNNEVNASQAIVEVITNMDGKHQQMLFNYLFTKKYPEQILNKREWQGIVAGHIKNAEENRKAKKEL